MSRRPRLAPGEYIYHVHNRANLGGLLFRNPREYDAFLRILAQCARLDGMRILAYCAMPNHWHLLLWPRKDGDLTRFVHRLTVRHTMRFHLANQSIGRGHLYQARFRSHIVEDDAYLVTVCRYIEANPLRAALVQRAADWPWSSARDHLAGSDSQMEQAASGPIIGLEPMPVELPADWRRWLVETPSDAELTKLRLHLASGAPYGGDQWSRSVAQRLGIAPVPKSRGGRHERAAARDAETMSREDVKERGATGAWGARRQSATRTSPIGRDAAKTTS